MRRSGSAICVVVYAATDLRGARSRGDAPVWVERDFPRISTAAAALLRASIHPLRQSRNHLAPPGALPLLVSWGFERVPELAAAEGELLRACSTFLKRRDT